MSLNLMTGYAGEPHITSADDGAVNASIYGASKYVLNTGQKFAYELVSNNLIKIKDGYAINQGRKIGQAISDYEELTIDNGLQGVKRSDIIAIRYSKNLDTGIESAEFVVIKGTSGDTYKDPEHITGNIIQGDAVDDFPLYRVKINGLSVSAVEPLFNVLVSMEEMQNEISSINSNISEIGTIIGNPGQSLSIDGSLTELCTITLSRGKWIVIGGIEYSHVKTARYVRMGIALSGMDKFPNIRGYYVSINNSASTDALSLTNYYDLYEDKSISIYVDSDVSGVIYPVLKAIKISA